MKYTVNNQQLAYLATGNKTWGADSCLLDYDLDLTAGTRWHPAGYTIEKLFDHAVYNVFGKNTERLIKILWEESGLKIDHDLPLDQYHKLANTKEDHLAAIEKTKLLDVRLFPVSIELLEERISDICQVKLKARNPFDGLTVFHFRVIRPGQTDNNPLHRDVWLEDYKDCINLYIPVAGSNENSSLIIAAGSHLWPESKVERTTSGAVINNVKFNVPAVTDIAGHYQLVRPNPQPNEFILFSPYLIHGGAVNLNQDTTRISIEIRLWKEPD